MLQAANAVLLRPFKGSYFFGNCCTWILFWQLAAVIDGC